MSRDSNRREFMDPALEHLHGRQDSIREGEPCGHPGCMEYVHHRCAKCGRKPRRPSSERGERDTPSRTGETK